MSRSGYDPRKVLRKTDNVILKEFFHRKGFLQDIGFENRKETEIDDIFEKIFGLEPQYSKEIDSTFRRIYELGCENGITRLIEEGKDLGIRLNDILEKLKGEYNKAFRVYLDYPQVFSEAEVTHFLYAVQGWKQMDGLPRRSLDLNDNKINILESELREYFIDKEGRGHRCKVEYHPRGDRIYICAYPENYSLLEISYDEDSRLDRTYRKPVIEVYFLYNTSEGSLSIKTKGGNGKKKNLIRIFIKTMLGEEYLPPDYVDKVFDLNKFFKKGNINFCTPVGDGNVLVNMKLLRIRSHLSEKTRQIILEGKDQEEIYKMIDLFNLTVDQYHVTKVKLQVEFERSTKKKSVTFELIYPIPAH